MYLAVSQRITEIKKNKEFRDSLDVRLIKILNDLNIQTIQIPNIFKSKKKIDSFLLPLNLKGLILTGGDDFGKYKTRDRTEYLLLKWALNKNLPIIGICRGMQLIGMFFKCKLIKIKNHIKSRHKLLNKSNFFFFDEEVNSYHQFTLSKCPKHFSISALSGDGYIEAIESSRYKILAFMWHPERNKKVSNNDIKNIKKILKL